MASYPLLACRVWDLEFVPFLTKTEALIMGEERRGGGRECPSMMRRGRFREHPLKGGVGGGVGHYLTMEFDKLHVHFRDIGGDGCRGMSRSGSQ